MKSSTKDNVEGKFHQMKGAVKEATGDLIDNPKLEVEGINEKIDGKIQQDIGKIKKKFGE